MERRAIKIRGIVQGVGFRPFVYQLATALGLKGRVINQAGAVLIEAQGDPDRLNRFLESLTRDAPTLARIDGVEWQAQPIVPEQGFRIEPSERGDATAVFIPPDVATCDDCLRELFDPADRRYRYPFLNCTNCGPRLTIIRGAPYDRPRTTMAGFPMCDACRAEYDDPSDRRFHAQPTACPACGPRLALHRPSGQRVETDDPLASVERALQQGEIVAIKGLGGFHLACDARNASAVAELRRRKHRDQKPFAVMCADVQEAMKWCRVDDAERSLLVSPRRPIVLLHKRPKAEASLAEAVAPGHPFLGVMLPYTPLHHLLMRDMPGTVLVMTSANRTDEPIVYENDQAFDRLGDIADLFLMHDRPIHVRCDDSVTRIVDGVELPLRRSRGYAPQPLRLPIALGQPVLAVGGQFKGAFALGRGPHALISHHMGDLDHLEADRAFRRDIALYEALFAASPRGIAHDLHPDYASTRYAQRRAAEQGLRLIPVQHHHAHLAAGMAEHRLDGRVIGVTFDGTGFGPDHTIWGGEVLVGGYAAYNRAAHLRPVGMPGGDRAIKHPWRMAVAYLADAACHAPALEARVPAAELRMTRRMLERGVNTPRTSSAGRLFDAVAALIGVRDTVSYEGQAAIELERLALTAAGGEAYPIELLSDPEGATVIDTRPTIRAIVDDLGHGTAAASIARRFHLTLVRLIVRVCTRIQRRTGLDRVVLSGGVWMNALLTTEACAALREAGFRVYRHRRVPPNDGGLCLGQLAVAAATLDAANKSAREGWSDVRPSHAPRP
jgi:hydrogenase maturation protein HypF